MYTYMDRNTNFRSLRENLYLIFIKAGRCVYHHPRTEMRLSAVNSNTSYTAILSIQPMWTIEGGRKTYGVVRLCETQTKS